MDAKMSTWRPGTAVCRCCLAEGCYKDISTEYFWMGKREVYAEMLTETFDLAISYSQSGGPNSNSRLICEPCISRLRDASEFKRQVYDCEKMFMQHLEPTGSGIVSTEVEIEPLNKDVKVEAVKEEKEDSGDDFFDDRNDFGDDDDDDDLDDEPLTKLATKVPKKEKKVDLLDFLEKPAVAKPAAEKRKAPAPPKPKATPVKKVKVVKEAKPSASKDKVVEKKKKDETNDFPTARNNAILILKYATAYPFRVRGRLMVCVFCLQEHEDPAMYREHMDKHHQTFKPVTATYHCAQLSEYIKADCTELCCRICQIPFDSLQDTAKHIHEVHDNTLNLNGEIGLQIFVFEKDKWNCAACEERFPNLFKLNRHVTTHYQSSMCDLCGKSYLTKNSLDYHIKFSHSAGQICRRCKATFPDVQSKRDHLRVSKNCWSFCCVHCGDRFASWELKMKHLEKEHGKARPSYDCPECNASYMSRKLFYRHYSKTHDADSSKVKDEDPGIL